MYIGSVPAVSNRATYTEQFEVRSDTDGSLYDLSTATEITVAIKNPGSGSSELSATLTGGEVTRPSTGIFQYTFTADQMRNLCEQNYNIGITIEFPTETVQILIGKLPVLDGVVS